MALAHGSHASPSDMNVYSAAVLAELTLGTVLSRILWIFENAIDSAAGLLRLSFLIVARICLNHSFSCLPLSPSHQCRQLCVACSLQHGACPPSGDRSQLGHCVHSSLHLWLQRKTIPGFQWEITLCAVRSPLDRTLERGNKWDELSLVIFQV